MNLIKYNKFFLFLGIICILYFIILKLLIWSMAFAEFWLVAGLILITMYFLQSKNINLFNYFPPLLRKLIYALLIIGLILFLILEGLIIYNGSLKEQNQSDYIIVLGAGLNGSKLSASLRLRLISAMEFHKSHSNTKIVVSGGQGAGEDISEALAMKNFLVSKGIPENLIIMEDKSTSTYENFSFSKSILEKEYINNKPIQVTVITNNFHMFRAKLIGERIGFRVFRYSAPCNITSAVNFYLREAFASVKTIILNK